jgi:hypothetical protein
MALGALEAADGWEPSELAEQLKREYARAKRRRNRWGAKTEQANIVVAQEDPNSTEALQARVEEINKQLKSGEVSRAPRGMSCTLPVPRPPSPRIASQGASCRPKSPRVNESL